MKLKIDLANPLFLYTCVWFVVLGLVSLQSSKFLVPLNIETLILVFSNILTFALIYYIFKKHVSKMPISTPVQSPLVIAKLRFFIRTLLVIWVIGTIFEIIAAKGVPLLWLFTNAKLNYANFGISSFHGIMNAFYLFSITGLFLEYMSTKQKKLIYFIGILLLWPVIMIGRGILLGALLQMLAIYFLYKKQDAKQIFKIILIAILAISIFGFIGDFRAEKIDISKPNVSLPYRANVSESKSEFYLFPGVFDKYLVKNDKFYFHLLPSGFTWFYFYMTAPINNIVANIKNLQPSYVPYYSIFFTIPTIIREHIFSNVLVSPRGDPTLTKLKPVDPEFNVSTFYVGFLADFGVIGAVICVAIIQIFCTIFYFLARQRKLWAMLAYAVIFECIVFSIFFNLFLLPVFMLQIVLAIAFKYYAAKSDAKAIAITPL